MMAHVTPLAQNALLGGSAFLAGAINSLAGGGTLLTYPALLAAGISPIHANATSTLSLVQGQLAAAWGYRRTLKGAGRLLIALAAPSLLGSVVGALILLHLTERSFALLVPWLILGATLLFLLSDRLRGRWRNQPEQPMTGARLSILIAVQFAVAIYGGFFGAGQSILMLATLGLCGMRDLDRMQGFKNFAAAVINGVAMALFIAGGLIEWRPAIIMAIAASFGGYAGARAAQRIPKRLARASIIVIGLSAAGVTFYKAFC
jgi:uncharacterized membrane protein YfcA